MPGADDITARDDTAVDVRDIGAFVPDYLLFRDSADFTGRGVNTVNFRLHGGVVRATSQVAVSMSEVGANGRPFVGGANTTVLNVAPRDDNSVDVRFNVDWPKDLPVRLNFVVVSASTFPA